MKKKSVKVVAGIFVKSGDVPRFLLSLRRPGKSLEGYWEFPGGKIEESETPEIALKRECFEELGVIVGPNPPLFLQEHHIVYPEFSVDLSFFHVSSWEGEPIGKEGQTLRWCSLNDLSNLKTLPLIKEKISEILRGRGGK